MSDRKDARKSLGEERQAVRSYAKRLRKARNPKLRKALKHALPEERTHARLFAEAVASSKN